MNDANSLISIGSMFNALDVLTAVNIWSTATTNPSSPRLRDILRDKINAVMTFFDFCNKPPVLVTPEDVHAYKMAFEENGLQPSTIYTRLVHVSSFYSWAMQLPQLAEIIRVNPIRMAGLKQPRANSGTKTKTLSNEQVKALLDVVRGRAEATPAAEAGDRERERWIVAKRDLAILLFFLYTGMRRREVIQLRWSDITFGSKGTLTLRTHVKTGRVRVRRIEQPGVDRALKDYLVASGRLTQMNNDAPLWVAHDRGQAQRGTAQRNASTRGRASKRINQERALTSHAYYKNLRSYAEEAGIAHINPHQTRHTYAGWVGEASGSMSDVQEALGHRDLATTRIYLEQITVEPDRWGPGIARRLGLDEED